MIPLMKRQKAPWFVRLIGLAFVAFGVLNVVGFFLLPSDQRGHARDVVLNVAGIALVFTAGIGVLLSRRWGWLVSLAAGLVVLVTGLIAFLAPPDVAFPGADPIALVVLVLPSLAVLAGLLSPQTLRWVRNRDATLSSLTPPPPNPAPPTIVG